jgi:nickel-dependent lactate racemase
MLHYGGMLMVRTNVSLAYGENRIDLTIPEESLAGPVIAPRQLDMDANRDVAGAIEQALATPMKSPRLREMARGRRVACILSDEFRAGQHREIARALVQEIAAGQPAQVSVLIATGSHDRKIYGERIAEYGRQALRDAGLPDDQVWINDCDDDESHSLIGTTPAGTPIFVHRELLRADLRVHGHEGKHHYMNGYSCFDKQIVPGLSMRKTIEANHKLALHHNFSVAGRSPWLSDPERQHNPFGEDNRDARQMSQRIQLNGDDLIPATPAVFGLDMISEQGAVMWMAAGDPDSVIRQMVIEADQLSMFTVEPTRYVVISPGGPPASQALYGVQNCFEMALKNAIISGGEALVIAPCDGRPDLPPDVSGIAPDLKSKNLFWDNLVRFIKEPLGIWDRHVQDNFELYLWKTDRVLKLFKESEVSIHMHCGLDPAILERGGFASAPDPQAWIDQRVTRGDGLFRFIENGNKLFVIGS